MPASGGRTIPEDPLVRACRRTGVDDDRVLEAVRRTDRRGFVPQGSEDRADVDAPVPIPHGQTTSQPSLIAAMIAALELEGGETVLEVGAGYGYQTALLARLAATVVAIERHEDLAETARANLAAAGLDDVVVLVGDGTLGAPEHAPYDAIVVAAAFDRVPRPLIDQLAEGGRLVQPVGPGGHERVTVFTRRDGALVEVGTVSAARFVRLIGEHGFPA